MHSPPATPDLAALSADERAVLIPLAVAVDALARSHLLPILKALGLRRANGRPFDHASLNELFGSLVRRDLLRYDAYASVPPEVAWRILAATPRAQLEPVITAVRRELPLDRHRPERVQREHLFALLDRDVDALAEAMLWAAIHWPDWATYGSLGHTPDAALAHAREGGDPRLIALIAAEKGRVARQELTPGDAHLRDLLAAAAQVALPAPAAHELARQLILRGRLDEAAAALADHSTDPTTHALHGWVAAARGDRDGASRAFAHVPAKKRPKKNAPAAPPTAGPEHVIHALMSLADPASRRRAAAVITALASAPRDAPFLACEAPLEALEELLRTGEVSPWPYLPGEGYAGARPEADAWVGLTVALGSSAGAKSPQGLIERLARDHERARTAGLSWLAGQLAAVARRLAPQLDLDPGPHPALLDLFVVEPTWERKLQRLERAAGAQRPPRESGAHAAPADAGEATRLVWMLVTRGDWVDVHPREQRRDAKGAWSKGRKVALERLFGARPSFEPLTAADRAICKCIEQHVEVSRGYHDVSYGLDSDAAYAPLAAHPHVYWLDDPSQRVTFRESEPSLHVTRDGGQLLIRLDPQVHAAGAEAHKVGPYEVAVVRARPVHERLGEVLGGGLRVPKTQAERVERIIAAVRAEVTVHSDIGAAGAAAAEVAPDARQVVQLAPVGEGLQVRVRVRPLGPEGPALRPGQGPVALSARSGGRAVAAVRDLAAEMAQTDALLAACPAILAGHTGATGEWEIADGATSLELVLQLGEVGDGVSVEWPAGKALEVAGTVGTAALRLGVRAGAGGYFDLSGELPVDGPRALELGELLRLVAESPHRFVPLSPGRFVALTERFREQLAVLARLVEWRGGAVALHPWAAAALEPLADEVAAFKAAARWREQVRARQAAAEVEPQIPGTLRAALRDYQREGFRWLVRLGQLGAGACLADDMGLGKTVQTLALLLQRGVAGPQLVVCPTSVVGGWVDEAARFAPSLRLRVLGSEDRAGEVTRLGPLEVLVVSYGLLQSEADTLAGRRWETVVLDEAQAIKNPDTLRARAAYALDAGLRVALTGTPVENRLDELWSLFHFLVPGLLGTRGGFDERFARPIARGERGARAALRQLVQPLLLRRLKVDVLAELPAKTETVLRVTLSAEEAALYDAVRRRALESLAEHTGQPNGQRRFRVLAEITRLRRACCHPRLVLPEAGAEVSGAAKLAAFAELVGELREGGHRALVFSQFVDHLQVVREWLDAEGVPYQYLDGSTPQGVRQERVQAFQAGAGELFLISLRAGGTGLNLTAADFVIHLDPWWNPAVEDQASDRAHRIGQERPVTVVRLIARGTIEERIVALHREKRDLADSILEGTGDAAGLDLVDLVALLAG